MFLLKNTSRYRSFKVLKLFTNKFSIKDLKKNENENFNKNKAINNTTNNIDFTNISNSKSNNKDNKVIFEGDLIMNEKKEILLYLAKFPFLEQNFFHFPRIGLLASMLIFIIKNPLYLKLPVALPIVTFSFFIYGFKYLYALSRRSHIIDQIWLSKDGKNIKFVFKKGIRTKKEDITLNILDIFNVKTITNPELYKYDQDNTNLDEKKLIGNFFFKYITGDKDFILLHRTPLYSKFDILSEIFDNKEVKFVSNGISYIDDIHQYKYDLIMNKLNKNKHI